MFLTYFSVIGFIYSLLIFFVIRLSVISTTIFLAHLVNQALAHEIITLPILVLFEWPTDDSMVSHGDSELCSQRTHLKPTGLFLFRPTWSRLCSVAISSRARTFPIPTQTPKSLQCDTSRNNSAAGLVGNEIMTETLTSVAPGVLVRVFYIGKRPSWNRSET